MTPSPDGLVFEGEGSPAGDQTDPWQIQQALEKAEAYNRWLHDLLNPYVGQRVLDAGCGMGHITKLFLDRELVVGVEIAPAFCEHLRVTFGDRPNFRLVACDLLGTEIMDLVGERVDTVLCVNVLEHLADDLLALTQFRRLLVPGGLLVLFVPAHPWLYGAHDRADGHYRRYTRHGLADLLRRAGYETQACRWVNLPGIPCWLLNKLLRRHVSEGQCSAFDHLVPLVARVERLAPPPVGLSLLAVGRVPG